MKYYLHDLPYMITVRLCSSLNPFYAKPWNIFFCKQDWLAGCFMSQLAKIHTGLTEIRHPENGLNWKLFFFLNQNICCGYLKESSQWDGSFEQPKHMFRLLGKKIITILRSIILLHWTYAETIFEPAWDFCTYPFVKQQRLRQVCRKVNMDADEDWDHRHHSMEFYLRIYLYVIRTENLMCWPSIYC